jgi:hypothetical protein
MLGPQPPRSAEESSHAHADATRSVAAAATQMMWAVALATTRASFASTAHGLALWSRMLHAPIGPWSLVTGPLIAGPFAGNPAISVAASAIAASASSTAASGPSAAGTAQAAAPANAPAEEAAAFASYRSSGGHASAQVITHH